MGRGEKPKKNKHKNRYVKWWTFLRIEENLHFEGVTICSAHTVKSEFYLDIILTYSNLALGKVSRGEVSVCKTKVTATFLLNDRVLVWFRYWFLFKTVLIQVEVWTVIQPDRHTDWDETENFNLTQTRLVKISQFLKNKAHFPFSYLKQLKSYMSVLRVENVDTIRLIKLEIS